MVITGWRAKTPRQDRPGAAGAENGGPGWPVARFSRRGGTIARGKKPLKWETCVDFGPRNPARSTPPEGRSWHFGPVIPNSRPFAMPGQLVRVSRGPGSAALHRRRSRARRRAIPHLHPTQAAGSGSLAADLPPTRGVVHVVAEDGNSAVGNWRRGVFRPGSTRIQS